MCQELDALRQSVTAYAGRFDPGVLIPSRAAQVVRICAQIEAAIASVKALAAARAAEGNSWRDEGYRSPADHLAHDTGVSPATAKRTLETGKLLAAQPEVADAALAGRLSADQAAAVCEGASANPAKARELIYKAEHSSLSELNDEVARTKAAVTDQEARRQAIHAKRSLRRWTDRDGAFQAHLYGNPEDGVRLWRMLDPIRRRLIILRRESTPNQPLDALDFDALLAMAAIANGADGPLSLDDLLDLGLFPQLDAPLSAPSTAPLPASPDTGTLDTQSVGSAPVPAPTSLFDPVPPHRPPHPQADSPDPAVPPHRPPHPQADSPDPAVPPHRPPHPQAGSPDPPVSPRRPPDPPDKAPEPPPRRRRSKRLAGSPARVMIRVDLDTLLRGVPAEDELCEMVGYGPVPVSVVEELLANDNAFVVGVLTRSKQIQGVFHHRRRPNAHQQSALDFLYPSCAVRGCSARAGLQSDHRDDWIKTKFTVFDLLDRLCPHHHRLKTNRGWGLVEGTGKRDFVPPGDPRHPGRASSKGQVRPSPEGRSPPPA